jgi:hypothetical protein
MLTIIGPEGGMEDASPEEQQAVMKRWFDYTDELRQSGAWVAGEALTPSETATTVRIGDNGDRTTTDGPYAETKEQVGGFYLVEVDSVDEALEWAKKIPARAGSIEVRAVMDFDEPGS